MMTFNEWFHGLRVDARRVKPTAPVVRVVFGEVASHSQARTQDLRGMSLIPVGLADLNLFEIV